MVRSLRRNFRILYVTQYHGNPDVPKFSTSIKKNAWFRMFLNFFCRSIVIYFIFCCLEKIGSMSSFLRYCKKSNAKQSKNTRVMKSTSSDLSYIICSYLLTFQALRGPFPYARTEAAPFPGGEGKFNKQFSQHLAQ